MKREKERERERESWACYLWWMRGWEVQWSRLGDALRKISTMTLLSQ